MKNYIKNIADKKNFIITKTINADILTPVAALLKLEKKSDYICLLESVTGGENKARYSAIALLPQKIWRYNNNKVEISNNSGKSFSVVKNVNAIKNFREFVQQHKIADLQNLPAISAGVFGFMSYDMIRQFENIPDKNPKNINIPDAVYFVPKVVILFDNATDKLTIISPIFVNEVKGDAEKFIKRQLNLIAKIEKLLLSEIKIINKKPKTDIKFESHITQKNFYKIVEKSKEYIRAGDIFQIVPSRRFSSKFNLPAISFYRSLRSINPSPYLFYYKVNNFVIAGSSPEIMVRLKDKKVTIRPIAGTRKRGETKEADIQLEKDLLADKKELAEHLMLLDLGRNDTSRVSKAGSLKVTEKMTVERYSHVMHIVSNVEGEVKEGCDAIDCLIAGFPAGTVSGAPKVRAMEIIDELEIEKRQFYAGTIGYISANGDMDTAIMLRTALLKDNKIYIQSGGGVVYDSTPEYEFEETQNKAKALIKAAQNAINYL